MAAVGFARCPSAITLKLDFLDFYCTLNTQLHTIVSYRRPYIHYTSFTELWWQLWALCSRRTPLLSVQSKKKLSPVLAKISTVFARIQKFDIMLGVITPKRHIVEWFHVFQLQHVNICQRVWLVGDDKKNRSILYKKFWCCISPLSTEAPVELIFTKVDMGAYLKDVIIYSQFLNLISTG